MLNGRSRKRRFGDPGRFRRYFTRRLGTCGSGAAAAAPGDAARDTLNLFETDQHGEREGVFNGFNHRVHGATARTAEAEGVFPGKDGSRPVMLERSSAR